MTQPSPIEAYFNASNSHDAPALAACFDIEGIVIDVAEDETHQGPQAIEQWAEKLNEEYQLTIEILTLQKRDGRVLVETLVSGDFDGSPLPFQYDFTLLDGKITRLEIQP